MSPRFPAVRPLRPLVAGVLPLLACAGTAMAQFVVDWVQPTGGIAIAVDADDDVYTVNYAYALGGEMTLTKRAPDGAFLWAASHDQTNPAKWERAEWLEVDPAQDVVVVGTLMSGYSNPVEAASIVMKFSPEGEMLWRLVYENDFDGSWVRKCLIDAEGSIYVLGMGAGPAGFAAKVKKLAPDGSTIWTWHDLAGIGAPVNFKFTPDGDLVIAARSIFGSVNGYARLGADGSTRWSLTGIASLTVGDAAGDAEGNTYVVHAENVLNGGTVIKQLDPFGNVAWETTHPFAGFRVEVGPDDRPIACGFPNSGTGGAAFVKLEPDGAIAWANLDADGPLGLLLHARLLVDRDGAAYLAAGTLFEMAVCKVNADGSSAWTATTSGGYARGIALGDGDRSVFMVGGTTARISDTSAAPGDIDGDGLVGFGDLLMVLDAWGPCPPPCPADLDADGAVGTSDLLIVLSLWNA